MWGGGCWEGADAADVCAGLTGAPSSFWTANADTCCKIIERRVTGIAIGCTTVAVVGALLWLAWSYTHYRLYIAPFVNALHAKNMARKMPGSVR